MRQISLAIPAALALLLVLPGLAQAQVNTVRKQVQAPVPMEFKERAEAQVQPPARIPDAAPVTEKGPEKAPAPPKPAPQAKAQAAPRSKFPNIDTAKNRQDYDISTPKADGIRLGRDEATGDTVMGTTPQKKPRQADPYQNVPIKVEPVVPWPAGS